MYLYLISLCALMIDQFVKWFVVREMVIGESSVLIDGILSLTSHRNKGAAFGILQNQIWFLIIVTVIILAFIVYFLHKTYMNNKLKSVALAFVLGGALGNFSDRIFRGEVVDMVEITFINYPIFNIADCFIVCGTILLFISSWSRIKREGEGNE
ncbi:signal peptidase II [Cohnella sp. CIP 111063]|nr:MULTISPECIES: signal peptidase II [unclassified Cohnella]OXS55081.1 signal peptidase II [Cohnella sp. CIP 111063]